MRRLLASLGTLLLSSIASAAPNIVVIIADDQSPDTVSAYGSVLGGLTTTNINRIATAGVRFNNAYSPAPVCTAARAIFLTGRYPHSTGATRVGSSLDGSQQTLPDLLNTATPEYQNYWVGKWHMVTSPTDLGFDAFDIFPVGNPQGEYVSTDTIDEASATTTHTGLYVTDVLGTLAVAWMEARDTAKPFFVVMGEKPPHSEHVPKVAATPAYAAALAEPATFNDTLAGRAAAARSSTLLIHPSLYNLWLSWIAGFGKSDPGGATDAAKKSNTYQLYAKDYLRVLDTTGGLDGGVKTILDYLEGEACSPSCSGFLIDNTVVIYLADNGMLIGEHGMYGKETTYDESIRVPLLIQYKGTVTAGQTSDSIVTLADLAPTILEYAGVAIPAAMQGRTLDDLMDGTPATDWRRAAYLHSYTTVATSGMPAWNGIVTSQYKLIHHYGRDSTDTYVDELIDLVADPSELSNFYNHQGYNEIIADLQAEEATLRTALGLQRWCGTRLCSTASFSGSVK